MSYTSDELDAAVAELVQGTLSSKRDQLGPKKVATTLEEIRELVNSALLYEPDSVFYLIFTASQVLQRVVAEEVETIDELLDSVDDLLRPNKPVDDVRAVADAAAALTSMEGALGRSGRIGAAEYSRYSQATDRATAALGQATKLTYVPRGSSTPVTDLARPRNEAKTAAASSFGDLKEKHADLLDRVSKILSAYTSLSLPSLAEVVAKRQVRRARAQLSSMSSELEGMTAIERTSVARLAVLKLLTNKSVLRSLSETPVPGASKLAQGVGASSTYRLSATGSGTPPYIEGSVSAPWPLEEGAAEAIVLDVNSAGDQTVDLLPSGDSFVDGIKPAVLEGAKVGPFRIYEDLPTPREIYSRDIGLGGTYGMVAGVSDTLHMIVDGVRYEVQLTSGGFDTVAQVVIDIAGSALGTVVTATEVPGAVSGTRLRLEYNNGSPPAKYGDRHMLVVEGAYNCLLGPFMVGTVVSPLGNTSGYAAHSTGWDANDELWVKPNDATAPVVIDLPNGTWNGDPATAYSVAASAVKSAIDSQAGGEFIADITDGNIVLTTDTGSPTKGEGAILTILSDGVYASGQPASDPKPGTNTPSFNGATELGFYDGLEDRQSDFDGKAVLNLINKDTGVKDEVIASLQRVEYLREQRVTRVASPTHNQLEVTLEEEPTGWPAIGELKVQVLTGDNAGFYGITGVSWSDPTFTLTLDRNLRDTDTDLLHEVVVYREVLRITSRDASVTGLIEAKDPPSNSARSVLGLPTGSVISTVAKILVEYNDPRLGWVAADLRRRFLKIDDILVNETTGAEVTSISSTEEEAEGLLGVSPEVQADLSLSSTQGFYVRSAAYIAYQAFESALSTWWSQLDPYDDEDLTKIDKALSPILLVEASTQKVNWAYSVIEGLKDKLQGSSDALLEILQSFSVGRVQQLEDALRSLEQQGHNRARAALLRADINSYLGMSQEDSSYGRAFLKAAQAVVVKDINEPTNLNRHMDDSPERLVEQRFDDRDPLYEFPDLEDDMEDPVALEFWEGLD